MFYLAIIKIKFLCNYSLFLIKRIIIQKHINKENTISN